VPLLHQKLTRDCDPQVGLRTAQCGTAWALTFNLYQFLTGTMGFSATIIGEHGEDIPGTGINAERKPFPLPANTQKGDVVFYRQAGADYVQGGGLFNHAAIIVDTSGPITAQGQVAIDPKTGKPYVGTAPQIADHDGKFPGVKAINDTNTPVQMILIVHIPDDIPTSSTSNLQLGCIPQFVQPYLNFLYD